MSETIKWTLTVGRDLHAHLKCVCPSKMFAGTKVERLMKTYIQLSGYADDNFFDNVNREPRPSKCPSCGRRFTQLWRRDGVVEIVWQDSAEQAAETNEARAML